MSPIGLVLAGIGIVLAVVGYRRARGPWARYSTLRSQDENVARYEAWRGGIRDRSTTGASVAMEILRRQVRIGVAIALTGIALVVVGAMTR